MNDVWRVPLERTWTRGSPPLRLFSGLPERARTLYVGVGGGDLTGRVEFDLLGTRGGFDFTRKFSLASGQTVAINADGMQGARIDLIASSVNANKGIRVTAYASPHPRDSDNDVTAWWIDEYATGAVHAIPGGARRLSVFTPATSLDWVMFDGAGVARTAPATASAGALNDVVGTHFQCGANFWGAFEIRL